MKADDPGVGGGPLKPTWLCGGDEVDARVRDLQAKIRAWLSHAGHRGFSPAKCRADIHNCLRNEVERIQALEAENATLREKIGLLSRSLEMLCKQEPQ